MILERTERRVRDDLLGAGPKTVGELRSIAGRLRVKYQNQLERNIQHAEQQNQRQAEREAAGGPATPQKNVAHVMAQAGNMAGGFFQKIKTSPGFSLGRKEEKPAATPEPEPTIVAIPPEPAANADTMSTSTFDEGDWAGTDIASATDAISNFSIGDEDSL
jgi:hypothetical protein